jgi:hypothetical protein
MTGASRLGEHTEDDPPPVEIADDIRAVYQDAALRGGRVIASHTLILDGAEHLFFVAEFPDQPATTEDSL